MTDTHNKQLTALKQLFAEQEYVELAFLIGSQATQTTHKHSDWDFALQWQKNMPIMEQLTATEVLRHTLATQLGVSNDKIDLVNIPSAGLAMRDVVANEGVILKGDNTLALSRFLLRTWREIEEFFWDKIYRSAI